MRPKGSAAELEARRLRAVDLLRDGKSNTEVARLVGADVSSVKRWKRAVAQGGVAALAAKPNRGRPPRLTLEQTDANVGVPCADRRPSGRLSHRSVDLSSRGSSDSRSVCGDVPSRPRGAHLACRGILTAETPAASQPAGRNDHRTMAKIGLDSHQKKGRRRQAVIVFLDETGFLLQPLIAAPGLRVARRRCSTLRLGTTACR